MAFVYLVATNTSWYGLRALRFKHRTAADYYLLNLGLQALHLSGMGKSCSALPARCEPTKNRKSISQTMTVVSATSKTSSDLDSTGYLLT